MYRAIFATLVRYATEMHLESCDGARPDVAHHALHRRVASSVAAFSQFAPQPHRGKTRKRAKPFARIFLGDYGMRKTGLIAMPAADSSTAILISANS
jgi:hypothetical protein